MRIAVVAHMGISGHRRIKPTLMDWFATFGVCHTWVSDQGSHFKNEVIEALKRQLGAHHHFTTAYAPWSNGTVEVMNRLLVRLLRGLCSELKLKPTEWDSLLPMVMSALNHMPADRLKGVDTVTVQYSCDTRRRIC